MRRDHPTQNHGRGKEPRPALLASTHDAADMAGRDVELARRCIHAVIDGAERGHLPLFAATLGLDYVRFGALPGVARRGLPAAHRLLHARLLDEWRPAQFAPLLELLLAHRVHDDPLTEALAHAIACACFGERHLWHDLGLGGRTEVSALLACHFDALHRANTDRLPWKRFLFLTLGHAQGIAHLLPPGCSACHERQACMEKTSWQS